VPLVLGRLSAYDFEDEIAADPRIDELRTKTEVRENPEFTRDYLDPERRLVGNAVQVHFDDGSSTARIAIDTPIGHRERRLEAVPMLIRKFESAVAGHFPRRRVDRILDLVNDVMRFENTPVHEFVDLLVP
jgi:2-methylcitrate dehydratase